MPEGTKVAGLVLLVVGLVTAAADIGIALFLKAKFPHRFKLLSFHPVLDFVAIVGVVLLVVGVVLWARGGARPSPAASGPR